MQPIIGITRGAALRQTYRRALEATGATVTEIGPETDRGRMATVSPEQALRGLHGLLLTGGGDLDPALYGAATRHPSVSVDADRDAMELGLARAAVTEGLPLLGICRGIQTLNVALGGSLWQDLPTECPGPVVHREPDDGRDRRKLLHTVNVVKDSVLAGVVGPGELPVNSIHHQAIRGLGSGLRVVATATDGVVEAVEAPAMAFAAAVQWHPEDLWELDGRHAALFAGFSAASRARA